MRRLIHVDDRVVRAGTEAPVGTVTQLYTPLFPHRGCREVRAVVRWDRTLTGGCRLNGNGSQVSTIRLTRLTVVESRWPS
jgi:hypothetical protein